MKHFDPYITVRVFDDTKDEFEKALRILRRKVQKSGIFQQLKERQAFTKKSDKRRLDNDRNIKHVERKKQKERRYYQPPPIRHPLIHRDNLWKT